MNIIIIIIFIVILYSLLIYYIPTIIIKTKKSKIHKNVFKCFITEEHEDYITIANSKNKKFIFYFPGINSENLYLHTLCKSLYFNLSQEYNIIFFKYTQFYNSINELSTYISSVFINCLSNIFNTEVPSNYSNVTSVINTIKNNPQIQINIIGMSYGCSIAIDCILKLQYMHDLPPINNFIAYKTFYSVERVIKYQKNFFIRYFIKFIMSSFIKNYYYNNSNIKYIKSKNIYSINHINDEIVNINSQFDKKFCNKYNIHLMYDLGDNDKSTNTYYNYFFGCHSYFNHDLINTILNSL